MRRVKLVAMNNNAWSLKVLKFNWLYQKVTLEHVKYNCEVMHLTCFFSKGGKYCYGDCITARLNNHSAIRCPAHTHFLSLFAPPLAKLNKAIKLSDKVGIKKIIWMISSHIAPSGNKVSKGPIKWWFLRLEICSDDNQGHHDSKL